MTTPQPTLQTGPIWIIDDDSDDREIVGDIFKEMGLANELVFLDNAEQTLKKLEDVTSAPFIIICDVNLPITDGFQLRADILKNPSKKYHSVPFIYWSSYASEAQITKAYSLGAHGFFIKEPSMKELRESFMGIINYWQKSRMPDKVD